jgi:hypothetical protein
LLQLFVPDNPREETYDETSKQGSTLLPRRKIGWLEMIMVFPH